MHGSTSQEPPTGAPAHEPGAPAPELIDKWLDNQNQQIEAKARETELAFQQDKHSFEFATLSIASQERDREAARVCARKTRQDSFWLIGVLVLILATLLGLALWLSKDAVALEIIKDIGLLFGGAFGGYGYGKSKSRDKSPDDPS